MVGKSLSQRETEFHEKATKVSHEGGILCRIERPSGKEHEFRVEVNYRLPNHSLSTVSQHDVYVSSLTDSPLKDAVTKVLKHYNSEFPGSIIGNISIWKDYMHFRSGTGFLAWWKPK